MGNTCSLIESMSMAFGTSHHQPLSSLRAEATYYSPLRLQPLMQDRVEVSLQGA